MTEFPLSLPRLPMPLPMVDIGRDRRIAALLAWVGAVPLGPFSLAGLHKFYLGQPLWGALYLLLSWTPIVRVACALEGAWLLGQGDAEFTHRWPLPTAVPAPDPVHSVHALAEALHQLEALRQGGLISELEFEQRRRHLLETQ